MDDVVISLLAPVSHKKTIDSWVDAQVDRLRLQARPLGIRLGRLVRAHPAQGGDWLIRVDREDRDVQLEDDIALRSVLTDMERLGLRPALFVTPARARARVDAGRPSRAPRRVTEQCRPRARRSPPI